MQNLKKTATLLTALFTLSILAVAIPVSAFPSEYGIFQPDPTSGTVEWSMVKAHSGDYSAYLQVNYPSNPPGDYGYTSDSNEIYILPYTDGNEQVPQLLDDLDSFSFWYNRPTGGDPIPPQVDIWLATGGIGEAEDEWLLGQIDLATTHDVWVEVTFEDITWIRATGGKVYGFGSAGLTAAKEDLDTAEILGFGVQVGSPATRDNDRTMEGMYYIDDIEINGVIYDFENVGKGSVSISGDARHPMVSISVNPTTIDITKDLVLGEEYDIADVTVTNTGETKVALTAKLEEDDGFFAASLYLRKSGGAIVQVPDWSHTLAKPDGTPPTYKVDLTLDIPRDAEPGEHTAVLVFWAEEAP